MEDLRSFLRPSGIPSGKLDDVCNKLFEEEYKVETLKKVVSGEINIEDFQTDLTDIKIQIGLRRTIVDYIKTLKKQKNSDSRAFGEADDEPRRPATPVTAGDSPRMAGFTKFNRSLFSEGDSKSGYSSDPGFSRGSESTSWRRAAGDKCLKKFHCIAGRVCEFSHTPSEKQFFSLYPDSDARLKTKTELCNMNGSCSKGAGACRFAHDESDMWCKACFKWGHLNSDSSCPKPKKIVPVVPISATIVGEPAPEYSDRGDSRSETLSDTRKEACFYRFRCSKGLSCPFEHSPEHLEFFKNTKSTYRAKEERCRYVDKGCRKGVTGCAFAHCAEDMFCKNCKTWGHLQTECTLSEVSSADSVLKAVAGGAKVLDDVRPQDLMQVLHQQLKGERSYEA